MHMVVPFGRWLDEVHAITFDMENASFANALKRRPCGTPLEPAEIWPLLDRFFAQAMHLQYPVDGAQEALARLSMLADVVILTNIGPDHAEARTRQLSEAGMKFPVIGSRGNKGEPLARLVESHAPSVVAFVDDLSIHHQSVASVAPATWRLHMVAEPLIAARIPDSSHAHVRIDDWAMACEWLEDRLTAGASAVDWEKV